MYSENKLKVNVKRDNLIFTLNKNMAKHKDDYTKAKKGFIKLLDEELTEKLEDLRAGNKVDLSFENQKPESHVDDYEDVIEMLEMSVDDTIELSHEQFKKWIKDDWDWKRHWSSSNAAYLSAAV